MTIFGLGGGFVFSTIHNVQGGIPAENLLALYEAIDECRRYPVG
jgi:uroporphyrinogen decarboxylase